MILGKLILLTLIVFNCFAARVVLLSSLETPKIWYHSNNWEIEDSLEKIFKNRFKDSGLELVIKEKVDQKTLWQELNNPENIAIFWLSHATGQQELSSGMSSDPAIIDFYGNDVKSLFTRIHPNLQYLGLIGCNAQSIIEANKAKGHYKDNPNLTIQSFDKKIDARKGLRKSIEASSKSLGQYKKKIGKIPKVIISQNSLDKFSSKESCLLERNVLELNITRTTKEAAPSISLLNNDLIFDLLPEQEENTVKHYKSYIPIDSISDISDLKIVADSNKYFSKERIELGDLQITPVNMIGQWDVFAKKDGVPIGITKNLFRYKGEKPNISELGKKKLFKCLE